jgi:hypothetical protein
MTQVATFKLRCVGCQTIEHRPAADCRGEDPPFCTKCFMPMVLLEVTIKEPKKGKAKTK